MNLKEILFSFNDGGVQKVHEESLGKVTSTNTQAQLLKNVTFSPVNDGVYLITIKSDQSTGFIESYNLVVRTAPYLTSNNSNIGRALFRVTSSAGFSASSTYGVYVDSVSISNDVFTFKINTRYNGTYSGVIDGNMTLSIYYLGEI